MMLPVQILDKIDHQTGDCWEWTAARRHGYGAVSIDGKLRQAHRVVYEALVGPIPDGLAIDHLCRNRACVNPEHLEPVTIRANVLRGEGLAAVNARQTHCLRGHPFDEANTRIRSSRQRDCRTCDRERHRQRRARL